MFNPPIDHGSSTQHGPLGMLCHAAPLPRLELFGDTDIDNMDVEETSHVGTTVPNLGTKNNTSANLDVCVGVFQCVYIYISIKDSSAASFSMRSRAGNLKIGCNCHTGRTQKTTDFAAAIPYLAQRQKTSLALGQKRHRHGGTAPKTLRWAWVGAQKLRARMDRNQRQAKLRLARTGFIQSIKDS